MGKVLPVLQENALGGVIYKYARTTAVPLSVFKAKIGCPSRKGECKLGGLNKESSFWGLAFCRRASAKDLFSP